MTDLLDLTDPSPPPAARALYAPHGRPGRFFNPWGVGVAGPAKILRWLVTPSRYDKRGPIDVPRVANDGASLVGHEAGAALTWIGHASFALHEGDDVVLTDPHFGPRALVPKRLTPPGLPIEAVPLGAFAVLSHNHYDHLDRWTVARLPPTVDWYVPLGMKAWFDRFGDARPLRIVELDWWQAVRRGRWTITCLPAQHWSNRARTRRNATLWCSWLLDSGSRRVYFAGDSGYYPGFAEIGRRFPGIDAALLPIGAYEPRWFMRPQHMDPGEAWQAALDLGARRMVPMHWGCFDLTDEPVDLAPRVLAEEIDRRGGDPERVRTMAVGERWELEAPADPLGRKAGCGTVLSP